MCARVPSALYDGAEVSENAEYINEVELSRLLRISVRTVQRLRANGNGPPFIRVGAKSIRYKLSSCMVWADQRTFIHRAEELTASKS